MKTARSGEILPKNKIMLKNCRIARKGSAFCLQICYNNNNERKIIKRVTGGNAMYRVYRVHRDQNGQIFHKVPVGGARTEKGARVLAGAQSGECIIVKEW